MSRMRRNKWTETCRKFYIVLWNVSGICELYYGTRVMNLTNMKVSSETVILSPYIFPVLTEMKISQFTFRHGMCDVTTVLIGAAHPLTYINCVFWGEERRMRRLLYPSCPPSNPNRTC